MKCKLCLRDEPLINSHIIPEWCYRAVYDNLHRLNEISTDSHIQNKCNKQKGVREKLLCKRCEGILSVNEKYAREVVYGGVEIDIEQINGMLRISSMNYEKFKLFQMSILWRAGIANDLMFLNVTLGTHEEILREMILNGDPGCPTDYGCLMAAIVTGEDKVETIDGIIVSPDRLKIQGHTAYRFIFAGSFWIFITSSHAHQFSRQEFFISKEGNLLLPLVRAEDTDYFIKLGRNI